jgi:SlyX protein
MRPTDSIREQFMEKIIQRLTDLEVRFTFQEELIEELNKVVTDCNLQVQRLGNENNSLKEMVRSLAPDMPESPDE